VTIRTGGPGGWHAGSEVVVAAAGRTGMVFVEVVGAAAVDVGAPDNVGEAFTSTGCNPRWLGMSTAAATPATSIPAVKTPTPGWTERILDLITRTNLSTAQHQTYRGIGARHGPRPTGGGPT